MTLADAMRAIEGKGTPHRAVLYRRHGIGERTVGLSYADVGALAKRIGINHALALELWKTGLHDARIVATRIADPTHLTASTLKHWLKACANYVVTDAVAGLAADAPGALESALEWIADPGEWIASAGWTTIALLVMREGLEESLAERLIATIERGIHAAPNRTRYAMNSALIAIGGAMPRLRARARQAATAIGVVDVNHGETGCKTPDAATMIDKMAAHRAAWGVSLARARATTPRVTSPRSATGRPRTRLASATGPTARRRRG
jgi:3-methyladenine DNA glycosylase AlkD